MTYPLIIPLVENVDLSKIKDINPIDIKVVDLQKFVGIIATKNKVYQIYPKYYSEKMFNAEPQATHDFKLIIDSINKHNKKHKAQIYESQDLQDQSSNIITLIFEIFNHFEAYGLYRVFEDILVENGLNEIHWERTINTQEVF